MDCLYKRIPQRSKSAARMKLYSINQYDGVADKIIVENVPNQNGCNTEMHRVAREARMDVCTT